MRKGLKTTLMAVAVAILAVQAMAMAPVISEIPSPVVCNAENVTPANEFVYPDAINLSDYVTDDETAPGDIVWSYEIVGTALYSINGKASMDTSGSDDPIAPGAKALNSVGGGEVDGDSNPLTITIRNTHLSPIGEAGTDPAGDQGIMDSETQAVTFYASDGTTAGISMPVWFYTDDGGVDRLMGAETVDFDFPDMDPSTGNWRWDAVGGGATSSFDSNNHFCMTTTQSASQDKSGAWKSPYGDTAASTIKLVQNAAYHIRLVITSSQTNVDAVPLFDIYISNFEFWSADPLSFNGQNNYGANFFVYSNVGGANGAVSSTGKEYNFWWTPSCVNSARWNDTTDDSTPGLWAASNAEHRNAFVAFRVLQSPSNTALTSQINAFGTLCLKDLEVSRADLGSMAVQSTVWEATSMTPSSSSGLFYGPATNATVSFSGGIATVTPSNGTSNMIAQVIPGNGTTDYASQSATMDDYPCPMELQSLYMVTMNLSAPTQTAADNPPQIMWLGADTYTNELAQLSLVSLKAWHHAMPSTTVTPYVAFFHSNYGTAHGGLSEFSWWNIFRPRFMEGNDSASDTGEAKTGAIRVHNVKVEKVTF